MVSWGDGVNLGCHVCKASTLQLHHLAPSFANTYKQAQVKSTNMGQKDGLAGKTLLCKPDLFDSQDPQWKSENQLLNIVF